MSSSDTMIAGRGVPHRDQGFLAPAGGDPPGLDQLVLGQQRAAPTIGAEGAGGSERHG